MTGVLAEYQAENHIDKVLEAIPHDLDEQVRKRMVYLIITALGEYLITRNYR